VLTGIDPLLTGELLWHLDSMGHGDVVAITDAHFPAVRGSSRTLAAPGILAPPLVSAIRSVLPLDAPTAGACMATPPGKAAVVAELIAAASAADGAIAMLERSAFYDLAASAYVTIRTGESRAYGNLLLRKGLVSSIESRSMTTTSPSRKR
jgi:L-fucose mutarotase